MITVNPFLSKIAKNCIESTEKRQKIFLKHLSHTNPARSTGSLFMDYVTRGGLHNKFITFAGLPNSGKTLTVSSIVVDACKEGIPVFYFDTEGNIQITDLEELFGGDLDELISKHIFNLHQSKSARIIENVFGAIEENLSFFPTKEYVDEKESWYYTFIHDARTEEGKKDQALLKDILALNSDLKIDRELSSDDSYGRGVRDYVKIPNTKNKSGLQAIFIIDSLANMIPEKKANEADAGGLLQEPKLFSTYLKRVCPDLSEKCIMLIATNQGYMEMPNGPYSAPKYIEKGGVGINHQRALGFVLTERAASTAGGEKEERNPLGDRVDLYTYSEFQCRRNRLFKNIEKKKLYRRTWRTSEEDLMGWDPYWDTIKYFELTEQMEVNRGKMKLNIKTPSTIKNADELRAIEIINSTTWVWDNLKMFILSYFVNKPEYKALLDEVCKEFEWDDETRELFKRVDVKGILFQQIVSGDIFKNEALVEDDENSEDVEDFENNENVVNTEKEFNL